MHDRPQLHFLGDWHYHPRGRGKPSRKDRRVLGYLTTDPDYQLGSQAIILIVCPSMQGLRLRGYRSGNRGKAIEIPTGFADLSPM